jgi:hypothetical protein
VEETGLRWRLSQRFRRFQVRRQAARMRDGDAWTRSLPPSVVYGEQPEYRHDAIKEACRILDADPDGEARYSERSRTIGIALRHRDGASSWLKLAQVSTRYDEWLRGGELAIRPIDGVPMSEILREFACVASGIQWHAIQLSYAPSPVVLTQSWIARPLETIDDRWLEQLKQAVDAIGKSPLTRWSIHPGRIARLIARRFGRSAPYTVDEWRNAHGDLQWSNLTAPNLMLLDWEYWGAAPRGFDAATLLSHSFMDPALFRRIEATFADDLDTPSGIVVRLFQFSRILDQIEAGTRDPREHRVAEAEARKLLRR